MWNAPHIRGAQLHGMMAPQCARLAMMEVSVTMLDAQGVDMEAFRQGYVMPATCFGCR